MVICLERGADLHMAQLKPLPLTVSCFSKIQFGFAFLVPAHPGSPRQRAVKRVCVCVCVCARQVVKQKWLLRLHSPRNLCHEVLNQERRNSQQQASKRFFAILCCSIFCYDFSAFTLLVGWQEGHATCKKNSVVGCWRGYLSGATCRLAYGPADATATHPLLLQ